MDSLKNSPELSDFLKSMQHENFLQNIVKEISRFDIVDLIEKVSISRFYVTVSLINADESDRGILREQFDCSLSFLLPLAMCYRFEGKERADADAVLMICEKIHENKTYHESVNHLSEHDSFTINYLQNNLTDTLEPFKEIPLVLVLSCEDSLIEERYGIQCKDIFDVCVNRFGKGFFNPIVCKTVDIKDFINCINGCFDRSFFKIKSNDNCYKILNDISSDIGEFGIDKFNEVSPLSLLNLKRKLFLRRDGILYNFHSDIICNRLARCIESLFSKKEEKKKWAQNYKGRTEELPQCALEAFLPGGKYHRNLYYKDDSGNFCECDGIYEFHNYIFTIEVKGNKFNPDPIGLNENKVKKSYEGVVNKSDSQSARIRKALLKKENFNILCSNGKKLGVIKDSNKKNLISLCIFFEDIGTYLSGTKIDRDKTIYISFYDLHLVLHSIGNPLLLIQYFLERSNALKDKRLSFNDELTFVSMFCHYFHFNAILNDNNKCLTDIHKDANISDIYFDNNEFGMDVELDLLNKRKPNIEISEFIKKTITFKNYEDLDDDVFFALELFLSQSKEDWSKIEESYINGNKKKKRLPRVLYFEKENGEGTALMLVARANNQYERMQNLSYAKEYFKYRSNKVLDICMISIGTSYSEYQKIKKTDDLMNDKDLDSCTTRLGFSIKEHIKL